MLDTIPGDTTGTITITTTVTAECPHDDLTDEYELTVEYVPVREAVEFGSLAGALDDYSGVEITQERLCEDVFARLRDALSPAELRVRVVGIHTGLSVAVERNL